MAGQLAEKMAGKMELSPAAARALKLAAWWGDQLAAILVVDWDVSTVEWKVVSSVEKTAVVLDVWMAEAMAETMGEKLAVDLEIAKVEKSADDLDGKLAEQKADRMAD